jgi:hypothetical protein
MGGAQKVLWASQPDGAYNIFMANRSGAMKEPQI